MCQELLAAKLTFYSILPYKAFFFLYYNLLSCCYLLIQRDALNRKSAMFALLNENGQKIICESSEAEAQSIQDKLSLINVQWSNAQNENVDQR